MVPKLLQNGFEVIAVDTFWFGNHLQEHRNLKIIKADLRTADLEGVLAEVDAVIHLACISNDPSSELDPAYTEAINVTASTRLIEQCKKSKIKRFVFASSSSVYGVREEPNVTEALLPEPLTIYSKSKVKIEEYLNSCVSDKDFDVVILRPATVYGFSPRLRLDVVCNLLSAQAFYDKFITVHGGEQLRPQIHIENMTSAYLACLNEKNFFSGEIFNVSEENYSVKQIAEYVRAALNNSIDIKFQPIFDLRSYKIDSAKFTKFFNINLDSKIERGIQELVLYFSKHPDLVWTDERYHNVKKMKTIMGQHSG